MDYLTYSHNHADVMLTQIDEIHSDILGIIRKLSFSELVLRHEAENEMLRHEGKKAKVSMHFSLKNTLKEAFTELHWIPGYTILDEYRESVSIDCYKNKVAAAITFNHYSFIGSDLLCFQAANQVTKVIDLGIYICCTKEFSKKLSLTESTSMTSFEKVTRDLEKYRTIVTVPVWVVGITG